MNNPQDVHPPRVALVTGSGRRRIGNHVARHLAQQGYHVVLHARRSLAEAEATAEEITAAGGRAIALAADLRDERAVGRLIRDAIERCGRLDAVVNTAGLWDPTPLEQVDAIELRRHFDINCLGTFLCCRHAGLVMVEQPEGGAIINLGDWAIARPYPDFAAYFASKGAIPTITRTFAVELARRNPRVRVNAVLPGPVMLPPEMTPQQRDRVIAATLMKREGSPQHVAHAVRFLIENDYVTGVCLPVDGGRSIYAPDVATP